MLYRPLIYAACDQAYFDTHAEAFCRSAMLHGHPVIVDLVSESDNPADYACARFIRLPKMLKDKRGILVADVDSVFNGPIEMDDEFDLGVFARPWMKDPAKAVLAGLFYCGNNAMLFAQELRRTILSAPIEWGCDQAALSETYRKYYSTYKVAKFSSKTMSYAFDTEAPMWTAKGQWRKTDSVYLARRAMYEDRAVC